MSGANFNYDVGTINDTEEDTIIDEIEANQDLLDAIDADDTLCYLGAL